MSVDEQVAALRAEARRRADADVDTTGPRGKIVCPDCEGVRMIETDTAGHGTYRPCERCQPAAYRRWVDGHHVAGHVCPVCRP